MTEAERQVEWLRGWLAEGHGDAVYGEQWGKVTDGHMAAVFQHLCDHLAYKPQHVVEIGSGGGRWSREIAKRLTPDAKLTLVDGTDAARDELERVCGRPFDLVVSPDGKLSSIPDGSVDLVFSFDTFVHFDTELFDAYTQEICRILKPGARLMLHYAEKWDHPSIQADPTGCFKPPGWFSREPMVDRYQLDAYGMHLPILSGFGSVFWSKRRTPIPS